MSLRPGMPARVVNLDGLRMPGKAKSPFTVGDPVKVNKVSPDGRRVVVSSHPGWFSAFRFEPL